jgi:hypothetical protein
MATWTYEQAGETYDDTGALYDGLDPTQAMSVLVGTRTSSTDITADVNYRTLVATDNGSSGRGLISFRIEQPLSAVSASVTDQAMVRIVNHALNTETHRGFIRSRKPVGKPGYDAVEIVADDIGGLLDDTFIPLEVRPAETMQARIIALWFFYRPDPLDNDTANIASIGSTLAAQTFAGVTLRQAIESTISQASTSADYFVDALGKLRVFTSSGLTSPVNIDNDAPTGGEDAAEELDIEYDTANYANRVYVQGQTPEASAFFHDDTAIAAAGGVIRTAVVRAPDCTTLAMAQALGLMYLGRVKAANARGSFTITNVNGWKAGQNVLITDSAKGLSAQSFRIHRVTTRLVRPGSTSPVFRYDVEFGGAAASSTGGPQDTTVPGSGQLVYGNLGGESRVHIDADGLTVTDGGTDG